MILRREFITGSAAAGLGLAASPAWSADRGLAVGAISESFVFPEWLAAMDDAVAPNAGDRAFWQAFRAARPDVDAETAGRDATLIALPAPGVELFAPAAARAMARLANDRLSARVRAGAGRVRGVAVVSGSDPGAAQEADRAIRLLGLSAVMIGANRGASLTDRGLWPVYAVAEAAGAAVYLPTSYAPSAGDFPYRALGAPGVLAGAAAESARHVNQLIFGGVLDAFPGLTVVVGRLGEGTPYWHSEMVATYAGLEAAQATLPQHCVERYFARNILLTTADMASPETSAFCAALLGPERILHSPVQHPSFLRTAGARIAVRA